MYTALIFALVLDCIPYVLCESVLLLCVIHVLLSSSCLAVMPSYSNPDPWFILLVESLVPFFAASLMVCFRKSLCLRVVLKVLYIYNFLLTFLFP